MTPTWEDGTEPLVGGGLVQAGKVDRQVRAALAAAKEVQPDMPKIGCVGHDCAECRAREAARCTSATIGKEPSGTELPQATAFSPEVMKAAHDSAVQQFGNTSRDLAREKEIAALEAKCKDYEAALRDTMQSLAWLSFGQARGYSDKLLTAQEAMDKGRDALAKHGGAS